MKNKQLSSIPFQSLTYSLPGVWKLLKESFKIFKDRFWTLFSIMVIPFTICFVFALIGLFLFYLAFIISEDNLLLWIIVVILNVLLWIMFVITLFIVNFLVPVSLIYAIKEREQKIGIKESLKKGWRKIISYLWISTLQSLIVMLGILFLIIPGVIFAIWFSLAQYILVSEDIKGIKALSRSKQLIKGNWWKVFGRFLVMTIIVYLIFGIGFLISFLFPLPPFGKGGVIGNFIGGIIGALSMPLFLIFGFLIYENLKKIKDSVL